MKKLLIFMLVLGMASMANAVPLLELRLDDVNVSTAGLGDYTLSITNNWGILSQGGYAGGEGYWTIEVEDTAATLDVNLATMISTDCYIMIDPYPVVAGMNGANGCVYNYGATIVPNSVLFDGIALSVTGPGTIKIYRVMDDGETKDVMSDSITLTPEPATIALLGLGGLLLRRRK